MQVEQVHTPFFEAVSLGRKLPSKGSPRHRDPFQVEEIIPLASPYNFQQHRQVTQGSCTPHKGDAKHQDPHCEQDQRGISEERIHSTWQRLKNKAK